MNKLGFIWSLPRAYKRLISVSVDTIFIITAFCLAHWARLGYFTVSKDPLIWSVLLGTIIITLIAFIKLGLYRAILRYLTFHAFTAILFGAVISALSITSLAYFFDAFIPRTVPFIYLLFLLLLCGGARLLVRLLLISDLRKSKSNTAVLVVGAGATGRQLAIALRQSSFYRVKGFIDKDESLRNTIIQGVTVYDVEQIPSLIKKHKISKVLLAIPRATRAERKLMIDQLMPYSVEVLTVPDFNDIVTGKAKVSELQDVAIGDLLGRDTVQPDSALMQANIMNKVVMVTGAGGSIGSELCRQITRLQPSVLVLFDQSEFALYAIDKELCEFSMELDFKIKVIPLLGSVQQFNRLVSVMSAFSVDTVYHCAAYKHVPLVEYNVIEGVCNNVFGTYHCAKAAIECGVESFVLISTDKAVRPTNVMGATKRIAELVLQALADEGASDVGKKDQSTRFCMVRFGNVLGSSGSVIPVFKKQIEEGGPITVTHPDIIRYFMTIPEAAQLVIQAGSMGKGGDVVVLDMGEPVKIVDLAKNLILLSGLEVKSAENLSGDIEINFTGLRPGEKLFEELLIGDDEQATQHSRIKMAKESFLNIQELKKLLDELEQACNNYDQEKIRQILITAPAGFNPTDGIEDLAWNAKQVKKVSSNNVICLPNAKP
jgi:FlaA1/EpsC-like NDP-sugar epimerase